jgi:hypothetical protein
MVRHAREPVERLAHLVEHRSARRQRGRHGVAPALLGIPAQQLPPRPTDRDGRLGQHRRVAVEPPTCRAADGGAEELLLDRAARRAGNAVAEVAETVEVVGHLAEKDPHLAIDRINRDRLLVAREHAHASEAATREHLDGKPAERPRQRRLHAGERLPGVDGRPVDREVCPDVQHTGLRALRSHSG